MLLESNSINLPGFCFLVRENPRLALISGYLLPFGQRGPSSRTYFWLSSAFSSETLVSHFFLAIFCFLVREGLRLTLISGYLLLFGQRGPSSRTYFWLSSAFWSERAFVSHLFLAIFCFLVREGLRLALFSGYLLLFGQRGPSSRTFFWLSSAFWSERAFVSHLFLVIFCFLVREGLRLAFF